MKNYLYCEQIAGRIKELLDRELSLDCARNVSTGDFGILPDPEHLEEYLPAVLINHTDVGIEAVNGALDVMRMEHAFDVYYLYPYDFSAMEDVPAQAKKNVSDVVNVLMNFRGLDGFCVNPSEEEAGGFIEACEITKVWFDSAETKLFREIDVPMAVGRIACAVVFRTYQGAPQRIKRERMRQ